MSNPETTSISPMSVLMVVCHFPDFDSARTVGEAMVEANLAACCNILDGCTSIFRWEGKTQIASEIPVYFKTTLLAYPALESALQEAHPYDVPEIIALPIELGLQSYLDWVNSEVTAKPNLGD